MLLRNVLLSTDRMSWNFRVSKTRSSFSKLMYLIVRLSLYPRVCVRCCCNLSRSGKRFAVRGCVGDKTAAAAGGSVYVVCATNRVDRAL
jgi:hypothetical protein